MSHVLNCDGGARGNPGPAAAAWVLRDEAGAVVAGAGRFLGDTTNNVAEYEALIDGIEASMARGIDDLEVRCDSELVVKQLAGTYRVKNEGLRPLYERAREFLDAMPGARVKHVRREENAEADALANKAMDARGDVRWEPEATAPPAPRQETLFGEQDTWDLTVRSHFDAAHALRGYPGECAKLHGHTWDVEVTVRGHSLDDVGIVYDFKTLKDDLTAVLDVYDHGYLNETPPFDSLNATAENLAKTLYDSLQARLRAGVSVVEVAVWESPVARIVYRR